MNSLRRQSSRTNNEVLELSSSSDESSNSPTQRERNVAYTRRQLVSQFNYLESHGHFDRRDRRSRIPFKPLPPGPVRPARMRQSERNMPSNTISASSSTRTTSAPHSSVSTNSATHEVGNQFSYVDDSIMSSNSVCCFSGRTKKSAAKRCPRKLLPGYDKLPRMHPNSSPSVSTTITTLENERRITMLEYERNRVKQYNYLNSHGFFGRRKKRASRPQPQPRPLPADSFRPP